MDKQVQITLIIVAGFVLLGILGFALVSNLNPSYSNTISVNGVSTIDAVPDTISVYFSIETKGDTSSEATDKNSEIYDKLKSSLINAGFSEQEIQTQSFNVYPNYVWRNNQNVQEGFIAAHSIKLEFPTEDKNKINQVIDAAVNSNTTISYINFELSQELQNQYKTQAIELASQDARTKAEAVANGLNKKVGSLVSVSVDDYYYYPVRAYDFAESGGSSGVVSPEQIEESVSIVPGKQEVSARVTVVFKIV